MNISQDDVWAAAAAAWAHNNNSYVKNSYSVSSDSDPDMNITVVANKIIMREALENQSIDITDADRELGRQARLKITSDYTLKLLTDQYLGQFDNAVIEAINIKSWHTVDRKNWGVIACLIHSYHKLLADDEFAKTVNTGFMGTVGSRVDAKIKIVKCSWSNNWNCAYITAQTDTNHLVTFTFKQVLNTGSQYSIRGTIKNHSRHWSFKSDVTVLNRVKVTEIS